MSKQIELVKYITREFENSLNAIKDDYGDLLAEVNKLTAEEKQAIADEDGELDYYRCAISAAIRGDNVIDVVEEYVDRAGW